MYKIIKRLEMVFVFFGYFIINLFFNINLFWNQLIFDKSKIGAVWGEVQAYGWLTEKFYEQLVAGNNPFGLVKNMLYPFGLYLGLVDAGNGLFYPLFKAYLSTHQSLSIVVALSLLAANVGMYLLLRKLNINKVLSFIIGAAFGYMTFLLPRGGHLSYWCHFVFPWFYLFVTRFFTTKNIKERLLNILGSSIFFVLALWLNFYYFVMLLISIFSLIVYFLVFERKTFFLELKKSWRFMILKAVLILIFLTPWLTALYDMFRFDIVPKPDAWGGAIEFASDLFNYFIPSSYSWLFTRFPFLIFPFKLFLQLYTPGSRLIFENFTYPGIIILGSFFFLFVFYRKINKETKKNLMPFFLTSLVFLILTLGPFLHVFGHWTLTVDDGIKIVVPLPYIVLHYIPFLNNVRVPGRIIVAFIFFAYLVSAYILNFYIKNKSANFKKIFFIILFVIFILDQRYFVDPNAPPPKKYPNMLYNVIKRDPERSTVLEIPFTVRDGFTYFGDGDAFQMIIGESIHKKPVLGGYTGRIADYKKSYYQENPFLGFVGRAIDGDINKNPIIDRSDLPKWQKIDIEKSKDAINFLDLKYVISDDERRYMATLSSTLNELGFNKVKTDGNYSLWERPLENKEVLSLDLTDRFSASYLGFGWHYPEEKFRWVDRRSSVMFKVNKKRKMKLNFSGAAFYKNQPVTIYLNKEKVGKINMTTDVKDYSMKVDKVLDEGINTIYFMFGKSYRPAEVMEGSLDRRQLGGKFTKIFLSET